MTRPPPRSTLFPYTTLFRSVRTRAAALCCARATENIVRRDLFRPHDASGFDFEGDDGERCFRSEEHTSELQSRRDLVCRLLLEKKKKNIKLHHLTYQDIKLI